MHRFQFKKGELYCESVSVAKIAKSVGSPFYCYSLETFRDHFIKLKSAFRTVDTLICYSVKANSNLTVLKRLVKDGAGLDIVSGGELFKALKVGVDPKKIVFASVGKSEEEIEASIRAGIGLFNVESEAELEVVNRVASRFEKSQEVAIRINPEVNPKTHHYITTGAKETKFGMDMDTALRVFNEAYRYPFLRLSGLHIHIGSQITESRPFVAAIKKTLDFIKQLRISGVFIETLNIGGGLGIVYSDEKPQTAQEFAKAVLPLIKPSGLKLVLEPGRFIAGNSGILVTQVLYYKKARSKHFVIVDAGMNDLIRPSIYGAYHEIVPVNKRAVKPGGKMKVDVVGPICESGDFLGKDRLLPKLHSGDLVAVMSCGAYGFTMSSNYNARRRVPEVIVKDDRFHVARPRETYDDLIRGERILDL